MNTDTTFRPMLAGTCRDRAALRYPVWATPKLDGIRCVIRNGEALTRSLKPVPNRFIAAKLRGLPDFDGELTCGDNFQQSTSAIMSEDGEPDFTYTIFDIVRPTLGYLDRMALLRHAHKAFADNHLSWLLPVQCADANGLDVVVENHLAAGYEGTMLRSGDGPYKYGRSTEKEGYLLKLKPMEDAEATITGFEEQEHNTNTATRNALGRLERTSHKAGKVGKDTLGLLVVTNKQFGEFRVGTGFDDALRAKIWADRGSYVGRTIKFRYQNFGIKDKPRIPVFLGFRDDRDM